MIIDPIESYQNLTPGSEKRVNLQCDNCGFVYDTQYNNYYKTQKKQNRNGETYCKNCSAKNGGKKLIGRKSKQKGITRPENRKEKHSSWRGGRYIGSDGYIMIHVKSGHNNSSGWKSYQKEHRVLYEEFLGRKLTRKEIIHHIDGDRQNNKLSNLDLCSNNEHRLAHFSLQEIGYTMYKKNLIRYDFNNKQYVANVKLRELLEHPEEDNQQPSLENGLGI